MNTDLWDSRENENKLSRQGPVPMASGSRAAACLGGMRYFGVEEANRLVPLLSRTFEAVRPLVQRAQDITDELNALGDKNDALTETLREEREALVRQIRQTLQPLQEMGLDIKGADGLVDFRAQLEGRTVYLCWRFGEPTVVHWHELDAGFAGRRLIDNPDEFDPSYLS